MVLDIQALEVVDVLALEAVDDDDDSAEGGEFDFLSLYFALVGEAWA